MELRKLQRVIIDALEDVKAQDIRVYDTTKLSELFDRVIIATGSSNRQTRSLALARPLSPANFTRTGLAPHMPSS